MLLHLIQLNSDSAGVERVSGDCCCGQMVAATTVCADIHSNA